MRTFTDHSRSLQITPDHSRSLQITPDHSRSLRPLFMVAGVVLLIAGSRAHSQVVGPETHILTQGQPFTIDAGIRDISVTWTADDTLALDPPWADWADPAIYLRMKLPPRVRSSTAGNQLEGDFQTTDGTWQRYFALPWDDGTPSNPALAAAPLTAAAATPAPSLTNGDFSMIGAGAWKIRPNNKDYKGGGFNWKMASVVGWTAYEGTDIEVWDGGDSQGTFIELDATKGSFGIKQQIQNPAAGGFVLTWKELGRNNPASNANIYHVKIYYGSGASEVQIAKLTPSRNASITGWKEAAFAFSITEAQFAEAAGAPIQVAFIPEGNNTYGCLIDDVNLLPVEFIIPKLDSSGNQIDGEFANAEELKVAKWENAFEGTGANGSVKDDFIGWDKDRFYVRIPGGTAMGIEAVKVATEDCPDTSYNDDATRIELTASGPDSISDSMILVSDDEDDDYSGSGAGADDQDDDRTHKVQLGGKLVIKSIFINGTEHNVNMKIPVPVRKVLQVDFIRMNVPNVHDLSEIERSVKITNERYAQVGIRINANILSKEWPTLNPDRGEGIFQLFSGDQYVNGYRVGPLTDEYKSFIDQIDALGVNVYFLTSVYGSKGIALTPAQLKYESGEIDSKYFDKAFVNFAAGALAGQTPAHELGHILAYKTVDPDLDDHNEPSFNLMHINNYSNGVISSKRFDEYQQSRMYQHSLLTDPP